MAVREFDGVDDMATLGGGTLGALFNGAFSIVLLVKPLSDPATPNTEAGYYAARASGGTYLSSIAGGSETQTGRLRYFTNAEDCGNDTVGVTAGDWQLLGVSKAAVTEFLRFHRKELGAGSWIHIDGTGDQIPAKASAVETIEFPANPALTRPMDYRIACAALFATELPDAAFEEMDTTPATQTLATLGAAGLWEFNQASTSDPVEDLVGSADETSLVGSTVVNGDDPPGWTFGLGTPQPTMQIARRAGIGRW